MKNRLAAAVVACLLLVPPPCAQGQEGLNVRIETRQEGLYRIPGERLKALFPLVRLDPERLALTHEGRSVPIEIFGGSDGHIDPSDEIIFFAERPDRRHSATETYILSDRGAPQRLKAATTPPGSRDVAGDARIVAHSPPGAVFDQMATVRQDVIRGPSPSPFFLAALVPRSVRARDRAGAVGGDPSTASVPMILDPRPTKGLPARITVEAFGAVANGIPQSLLINVNGTDLAPQSWDTPLQKTLTATIPPEVLRDKNVVRFANVSDVPWYDEPGNEILSGRRNDLLISRFSIEYDAQLNGPSVSGQQTVLHVAPAESQQTRRLRVEQRQREGYLIVEPRSGRMWRTPVVEIPSDREVTLAVCSLGGAYLPQPEDIHALRPTREHLGAAGGDYVIVTTADLKPAVSMLADHRRADGFTPVVIEARELYDAFTYGAFHPAAIQRFLAAASANWTKKPRYLLLVGDADQDCNFWNQREPLPAWMVMTDYNGLTATDALHADVDGDGLPDIPVGRIPTRTREDFLSVARRIIAIEAGPPPGAWRRTLQFVAGEGRFGPVIDKILEGEAAKVLAALPPEFDVQMTYGNPQSAWYWPAEDFNAHLIRSFNRGALVFTYIGHGSPEAFDHVNSGRSVYSILTAKDIESLNNEGRSPVMAIIACSTGRYDDPNRDCLAEKMLLKEGGPIAVIAASRISHPYPNALLGKGIAQPFFEKASRVGDAFLAGNQSMIAASKLPAYALMAGMFLSKAVDAQSLVRDHAYIYNLFGDPAQRVPFPRGIPDIAAPETAKAGETVTVQAKLPAGASGEAVVSIQARRDRRARPPAESGPANASADEAASRTESVEVRHDAANDHTVVRGSFKIENEAVSATLAMPAELQKGDYWVVVFCEGDVSTPAAAGARKIRVE